MASAPKVSVVMSVYNGQDYLAAAIDSILGQSCQDFELIVINDGSKDSTADILAGYKDQRLRVMAQTNQGLVASLNRGIESAKGIYVARHDADDISAKERLQKEVDYLEAHPEVVIVGSSMAVIDAKGKELHRHAVLLNDPELRQELLVRSPFAHGSVMFRRQAAIDSGLYRQDYWPAEDYDLWLRLSTKGQLANLDEYLYNYREHDDSISSANNLKQAEMVSRIQQEAWQQKDRLVSNSRIHLSAYKKLDMGQRRIDRIMANIAFAARQAFKQKSLGFAVRNSWLIARDSVTFRRAAGKLKRKVAK